METKFLVNYYADTSKSGLKKEDREHVKFSKHDQLEEATYK